MDLSFSFTIGRVASGQSDVSFPLLSPDQHCLTISSYLNSLQDNLGETYSFRLSIAGTQAVPKSRSHRQYHVSPRPTRPTQYAILAIFFDLGTRVLA